jgi:hypothetical protein
MSKKNLVNENNLGVNPLSISLEIKVANIKTAESLLCEFSDGINLPIGTLEKKYLLDSQRYTKLYHSAFWRDVILDLTPKALQVWTYICFDLESGKDYYWVNNTFIVTKFKFKNRQELDDIIHNQLIRYSLLAMSTINHVYWINPHIVFCGNRLKKYPKQISVREVDKTS